MSSPSASPRRARWETIAGVVVLVVWLPLALTAGAFLSWPSQALGWLWSTLALAPGVVGAVLLWRVRSGRWLAGAVAVSLLVGTAQWYTAPPTHERLLARAAQITWPAGWQMSGPRTRGNTWCFKGCPMVEYKFDIPGGYHDQEQAQLVAALKAAGWTMRRSQPDLLLRDGRWKVTVLPAGSPDIRPEDVIVTFTG